MTGNWFSLCMWFHCLYISKVICWQETKSFVYNILMTGEYRKISRNWCFYGRVFSLPMIWLEWWLEWKNVSHVCPVRICYLVTSSFSKIRLFHEGYHSNCIFHVFILHMLRLFFSFADMIKVKRILIRITKLVLSRKMIFF